MMKLMIVGIQMAKRDRLEFTTVEAFIKYPYKKKTNDFVQTSEVFVKKEEHSDDKRAVTYKEYQAIIKAFNENVLLELFEGNPVMLPYALGEIQIKRYVKRDESKYRNINWHETMKHYGQWNAENPEDKKFIEYDNSHTNGQSFYTKWKSAYYVVRNKQFYKFRLSLSNRKRLADLIRQDPSTQFKYQNI